MHPDRTMASISIEGRHELERFFLSFAPDRETYALPVVEALRTCGESSRRSLLVARIDGLVRDSMLDLSKKSCLPLLSKIRHDAIITVRIVLGPSVLCPRR